MLPTIGITAGDPAGIGLEVTLKSITPVQHSARWVLFTDRSVFERNVARFNPGITSIESIQLRDLGDDGSSLQWGRPNPRTGRRALAYLEAASRAVLAGEIDAIVTAPLSKEWIGGNFHGQTDLLAERAGVKEFAMAFFAPTFKVVLATIHLSLRDALEKISTEGYARLIRFVDAELHKLKFDKRRIAVAAINPHAGEGGMFGREDLDILAPAVEQCAEEGISVSGPHSADSLYYRAHSGEFDVVIAPYHDQGLIPVKLIAHGESTNVTLGLPYVRTSPDHGTAFSIAGKGEADPAGMESALRCALDLVKRRSR
jgi:4-phospho-D-threonate 3-dehydrogenase / 4-phospho-D-erythronate 3-dehydrogenase